MVAQVRHLERKTEREKDGTHKSDIRLGERQKDKKMDAQVRHLGRKTHREYHGHISQTN